MSGGMRYVPVILLALMIIIHSTYVGPCLSYCGRSVCQSRTDAAQEVNGFGLLHTDEIVVD
jgi:hypothetical protein